MGRIATAFALVLLLVAPVGAGGVMLSPGEPAPAEGVFYSGDALVALIEALRDRDAWRAQVVIFREQVHALNEALAASRAESTDLRAALDAQRAALAKAELLEQNWDKILGRYEDLLQKLGVYAERLEQRVSSLERQRNLALFANPIVAILSLIAMAFFR